MGTDLQLFNSDQNLKMWAERVRQCRTSGMKVKDWCEANGINKYTYYDWQKRVFNAYKLQDELLQQHTQFVELKTSESSDQCVARIRRNGYDIEIMSVEALARLLTC